MREYINYWVLIAIILILCGVVILAATSTIEHNLFMQQMTEFKDRGGRNTSDMGFDVCERLNVIERQLKVPVTDCEAVYR